MPHNKQRKSRKVFLKGKVCGMLESGRSVAEIARELPISRRMIERWRANGFPHFDKPCTDRPRQTCSESDERMVGEALRDPFQTSEIAADSNVSRLTVQRRLREADLEVASSLPHSNCQTDKSIHLDWAMKHCHWKISQWRRVVLSDEASVRLHGKDGRLRLWIRSGQEIPSELGQLCRQEAGWLLVWGSIWFGGRSDLVIQRETMNSVRYRHLLEGQIYPLSVHLGDPSSEFLFMDDNAPPHRSLLVKEF